MGLNYTRGNGKFSNEVGGFFSFCHPVRSGDKRGEPPDCSRDATWTA